MPESSITVALVTETFHDKDGPDRLTTRLQEAREKGARLAVLPELPLNPWSPATRTPREEDAEEPDGPRERAQRQAAREAGIGLLGGIIVRDPADGRRYNEAILMDGSGEVIHRYRKLHLPQEEGFWEADHYDPGRTLAQPVSFHGLRFGVQICSDNNRPQGSHLLGAGGAQAILAPRATPAETYQRWRLVLRANAVTSACYVISVNRPGPEAGVEVGGASLAIDPNGVVLAETLDPLTIVELDGEAVARAKEGYPGYLDIRSDLYASGWSRLRNEG
jgi:predicted amidohydrolase